MLWEVEIRPAQGEVDRDGLRVLAESKGLGLTSVTSVAATRSFLLQGDLDEGTVSRIGKTLLVDPVTETAAIRALGKGQANGAGKGQLLNVLFKPGVTDNVAHSTLQTLKSRKLPVEAIATCRKYLFNGDASAAELKRIGAKVLSNDAIEHVVVGALEMDHISVGGKYEFKLGHVAIRGLDDAALMKLSKEGQLYLQLEEMRTIRRYFEELGREPTDVELETVAQTWSEHCSHKTLAGRVEYTDERGTRQFKNMLKETIFAATQTLRQQAGADDWCVSVFKDNAGIVKFDETQNVCIKVETHNHPSALEPYGGANTGLGGVIRDPLGTGMGARPVCNTDIFCFAPPNVSHNDLPPGVLHPKTVAQGVISGVRDYGNRMGIPTVNGAIFFDERYLGNPLVYCGNVAIIPVDLCFKKVEPGDLIVAVGGRTGRDGIHGATFSSAELTEESESISGGAVQIGNAVTEKMLMDVVLKARDLGLYHAITDCGAGGFSSAVGEMGEETGAEVWLENAPLKYSGLSYTEIWISEAQERMVLAVPPQCWDQFRMLCASEGVEAAAIGQFTTSHRLVLTYKRNVVADLAMSFLHEGRPPVVRKATYQAPATMPLTKAVAEVVRLQTPSHGAPNSDESGYVPNQRFNDDLKAILGSWNVCSKEWVIRQYDHEVQAGSVVKPLVGVLRDGPSDAAVVRPDLKSNRGLVISNGMNPRFGDFDPYWMAASAIDEAVRNCVAVGADPARIAILDNFCWGNCERAETLGSLVRAAIACQEVAIAFGTPFVSGKDSLNNEFSYFENGEKKTVAIPSSLLISALGQIENIEQAVTMDLKAAGNRVFLIGTTKDELGGSHYSLVNNLSGGQVPHVDLKAAPQIFKAVHAAMRAGLIESCHDLSEGGLAAAAAEMAFAGGLGVQLDVAAVSTDAVVALFSESNTRFLIEVAPASVAALKAQFANLPLLELGGVTSGGKVTIATGAQVLIDADINELRSVWKKPLNW